jgi:hypothetical protein
MRGRPVGRFLGDMATPRRPGEFLLQFLVGKKTRIVRSVFPCNISNGRGSAKSEHKTVIVTRYFMCRCSYFNSRTILTRKVKF